jgi:hypothetical protein
MEAITNFLVFTNGEVEQQQANIRKQPFIINFATNVPQGKYFNDTPIGQQHMHMLTSNA